MEFVKYIMVLAVFFAVGDAGGHGESHHDHVNLHVPEFIHHDHHTKVITIHHHHHKPKKEHHHHHHHHHKPHIPHGPPLHHHTHHHTKTSSHSISKGHASHLGKKSHNHSHRGHHGHRTLSGHRGHEHKHHDVPASYDPPSINYEPPVVNYAPPSINYGPSSSDGSDYGSFLPSVSNIPSSPHVHGVVHTVKQVKVFDSLPGALPGSVGNTGSTGYEVTEHGDEGEADVFTSVNSLSQSYPGTYGFVRSAAAEEGSDLFSDISPSNTIQSPNHDPFASAQAQPTYTNVEDFTIQNHSPLPSNLPSVQPASFSDPIEFDNSDNPGATGNDVSNTHLLSFDEGLQEDTPVTFSREAGLQHAINTEGIETIAY